MGPYTEAQVREMLAAGTIANTDLAWHEGMTDWKPVSAVLAPASTAPPVVTPPGASPPVVAPSPMTRTVIDPNLAGRGARLGAFLLDLLILSVSLLPGIAVGIAGGDDNENTKVIAGLLCGLGILLVLIVQFYLLSTRGQTIGKKVVGVKVVKYADGSNPGFVYACLLRLIVPGLISNVPIVGFLFSIVDVCFIFSEERRCIHDQIAGTKVVNA